MSDEDIYLQELLAEIETAKQNGQKGVFRIGAKINHNTAHFVESYFLGKSGYNVTVRYCAGCGGTWDIMIHF